MQDRSQNSGSGSGPAQGVAVNDVDSRVYTGNTAVQPYTAVHGCTRGIQGNSRVQPYTAIHGNSRSQQHCCWERGYTAKQRSSQHHWCWELRC